MSFPTAYMAHGIGVPHKVLRAVSRCAPRPAGGRTPPFPRELLLVRVRAVGAGGFVGGAALERVGGHGGGFVLGEVRGHEEGVAGGEGGQVVDVAVAFFWREKRWISVFVWKGVTLVVVWGEKDLPASFLCLR